MLNFTEVLEFHKDNMEMWRLFKNIIWIIVFVKNLCIELKSLSETMILQKLHGL